MKIIRALAVKEIRAQLPFFVVLALWNKWTLPAGMISSYFKEGSSLAGIEHFALFGRWIDDWPLTFLLFGSVFCFWGYRTFGREWESNAAVWLRSLPTTDYTPPLVKITVGVALVFAVFILDFSVGWFTREVLLDHKGGFAYRGFAQGKAVIASVYLTWFLLGCAIAQVHVRRKTLVLTALGLLGLLGVAALGVMFVAMATENYGLMRPLHRHQTLTVIVHLVLAAVFGVLAVRGNVRREIA